MSSADGVTDKATSHLAKLQKPQQAIDYKYLTDETPSHCTKLPKGGNKVAGYRLANNARQVSSYSRIFLAGFRPLPE
jgi:hypothetical protein